MGGWWDLCLGGWMNAVVVVGAWVWRVVWVLVVSWCGGGGDVGGWWRWGAGGVWGEAQGG